MSFVLLTSPNIMLTQQKFTLLKFQEIHLVHLAQLCSRLKALFSLKKIVNISTTNNQIHGITQGQHTPLVFHRVELIIGNSRFLSWSEIF